jgi:hypothetical protein
VVEKTGKVHDPLLSLEGFTGWRGVVANRISQSSKAASKKTSGLCHPETGRPFFIAVARGDGHPKYTAPTDLTLPGADTVHCSIYCQPPSRL